MRLDKFFAIAETLLPEDKRPREEVNYNIHAMLGIHARLGRVLYMHSKHSYRIPQPLGFILCWVECFKWVLKCGET
jgi:hypothetical protein